MPRLVFSPRYRAGWAAGVAYCLERIATGEPLETVARDALAVADAGATDFSKSSRRNLGPRKREQSET